MNARVKPSGRRRHREAATPLYALQGAFTLMELILVMALLVIAVSLASPALSGFIRGQALDSEARRLLALAHAGQARAVSEGMPMVLWVDEKQSTYGLEAETTGKDGDAKAEKMTLDENVQVTVPNPGTTETTRFRNLPAIRFLTDGTVDEGSPQTLRLVNATGRVRWFIAARDRSGYEIRDTQN
jgi:type II secretion system protein H